MPARSVAARALIPLGRGLLAHPANRRLRRRLARSSHSAVSFYRDLQFLFFRIASLFLAGCEQQLDLAVLSANSPELMRTPCGEPIAGLMDCRLDERDLRMALDVLSETPVDFAGLYEELLLLRPRIDVRARDLELVPAGSAVRKQAGAYYTPAPLVERLLRSAPDPVLDASAGLPTVCDPSCGCGHFLVAAAQRIAGRLASAEGLSVRDALRQVVPRCVFGVDTDPLAIELCRVNLGLLCGDPNQPCSFLGSQIRCGNSLVGASPSVGADDLDEWTADGFGHGADARELRARHGFFHWRPAFPQVFSQAEEGGFDVVLGNPPWERVKVQEKERLSDGELEEERRRAAELSRFLRHSGRFPLSARGDLNLYGPFVETSRDIVRRGGRVGLVVPSGLATDDSMKDLFQSLLRDGLVSWYDFHNRGRLFPAVQGNIKFGLLTLTPGERTRFTAAAQLRHPDELDAPGRTYELTIDEVSRLNPNTQHCPAFASSTDADLVSRLHERFPVLVREGDEPANPWGVRLWTMFHMTNDSAQFHREEALRAEGWALVGNRFRRGAEQCLPLYEAKLMQAFNHRASTFAGVAAARRFGIHAGVLPANGGAALPRYWVSEAAVRSRAGAASWLLGFRNAISAVSDARSLVAAVIPRAGAGNSLPLISGPDSRRACLLLALLNSFVVDYVLRQKASGSNLNFHVLRQLPVPAPGQVPESVAGRLMARVLELTCTTKELSAFARECGHRGRPFSLDEQRRWQLRCEIDADCFRLYGMSLADAEHVLGSFPVLERRERSVHGGFRTREAILQLLAEPGGSPNHR